MRLRERSQALGSKVRENTCAPSSGNLKHFAFRVNYEADADSSSHVGECVAAST